MPKTYKVRKGNDGLYIRVPDGLPIEGLLFEPRYSQEGVLTYYPVNSTAPAFMHN